MLANKPLIEFIFHGSKLFFNTTYFHAGTYFRNSFICLLTGADSGPDIAYVEDRTNWFKYFFVAQELRGVNKLIEERIALPCSGMNSVPSGFRLSLSYETTRNKMEDYKRRALEGDKFTLTVKPPSNNECGAWVASWNGWPAKRDVIQSSYRTTPVTPSSLQQRLRILMAK